MEPPVRRNDAPPAHMTRISPDRHVRQVSGTCSCTHAAKYVCAVQVAASGFTLGGPTGSDGKCSLSLELVSSRKARLSLFPPPAAASVPATTAAGVAVIRFMSAGANVLVSTKDSNVMTGLVDQDAGNPA